MLNLKSKKYIINFTLNIIKEFIIKILPFNNKYSLLYYYFTFFILLKFLYSFILKLIHLLFNKDFKILI
jgi:hypothetical protein